MHRKGLELANRRYLNGLRHSEKRVLLRRGSVPGSLVAKSLQADARQTQLFAGFSLIGFFCVSGFLPLACTVGGGFSGVFVVARKNTRNFRVGEVLSGELF